jgi:serine/threonine protein kinase
MLIKKYTIQILKGLDYLHSLGKVHMNLVASNVLVDESGIIKISDYIEFNNLTKFNTKKIINIHTKNMNRKS